MSDFHRGTRRFDDVEADSVSTDNLSDGVAGSGNTITSLYGDSGEFIPVESRIAFDGVISTTSTTYTQATNPDTDAPVTVEDPTNADVALRLVMDLDRAPAEFKFGPVDAFGDFLSSKTEQLTGSRDIVTSSQLTISQTGFVPRVDFRSANGNVIFIRGLRVQIGVVPR